MPKRIIALAFAVAALAPALAFAQLEAPQPTTRSGALIGDSYTFSWDRVPDATWYQLWVSDGRGVVRTHWTTAADAGCAPSQSTTVCSLTRDWPLSSGNSEWWVRAWVEPGTFSAWGPGQKFTVVGRVPMPATGASFTALGRWAMYTTASNSPSGSYGEHVAIGEEALMEFDAGRSTQHVGNTAVGSNTLRVLSAASLSATMNTAVGRDALRSLMDGAANTAVGWSAGINLNTGNDNVYLASPGVANESSTMRLGNSYQTRAFMSGVSGATSAGGVAVFVNNAGQLGTLTSSARFKANVRPIDRASERLFVLKPVAFEYKSEIDPEGLAQFGLLAEDVEKAFPELLVRDAEGKPQTVRYHLLVPLLLNEVQKQQALVTELSAKTAGQERRLDELAAQIEALTRTLQNR